MSVVVLQRLWAVTDRRGPATVLSWVIMRRLSKRNTSLALIALGAITALACVSAIGAATTLVVMAMSPEAEVVVPYDRDCSVVAWKSGEIHCFRGGLAANDRPSRGDLAVVTQAGFAR